MNLRTQKLLAATIVSAMVSASGIAEATPFNLDIGASKDSFLRYRRHNINEGANEILVVRPSVPNRPVMGFDLTGVNAAGVTSARLIVSVKRNRRHWGRSGQTVDVHPLLADFTEGNGKTFMVFPGHRRGTGAGVTWECASDANIANTRTDCDPQWDGGSFGPTTASVIHLNTTMGEVSFDVTGDVQAGRSSWLLKKTDEQQPGRVDYYSREGAAAAGSTALAPRLVIAGATCTPSPEVCDGIDNDCDDQVDDGNPGGGEACNTGLAGVCAAGTTACSNGSIVCNPNVQPSAEACDGLDNDCDVAVDNGNPGGGVACSTGNAGVCDAGTTACTGGSVVCNQNVQPSAESCDGSDNDCNGQVDDGLGQTMCGVGACMRTVDNCVNGAAQSCTPGTPMTEICGDGLDNDCNGEIDEGCICAPGSTAACYGGPGGTEGVGICMAGTQTCNATGMSYGPCVGDVTPIAEVCGDGLDNDCDGQIDEGCVCTPGSMAACYSGPAGTAGVGICMAGTQTCNATGMSYGPCVGDVTPIAEVCGDGLDNDCDGQVDEGCVCAPGSMAACYSGPAGTAGVGICMAGTQTCNATGTGYGACAGEVTPAAEMCSDGLDNDCDGVTDACTPGCFIIVGNYCLLDSGALGECVANVCQPVPGCVAVVNNFCTTDSGALGECVANVCEPLPPSCCINPFDTGLCFAGVDPVQCLQNGGSLEPGAVCNPNGGCTTPETAPPGRCCELPGGTLCTVAPLSVPLQEANGSCREARGEFTDPPTPPDAPGFVASGVCLPSGMCEPR